MKISGSNKQRWTAWAICSATIALLSLAPAESFKEAPVFPHIDKVVHFIMYGTNAALLLWALNTTHKKKIVKLLTVIIFCSAFGITMELLQRAIPAIGREFSYSDIIANITGALFSVTAMNITKAKQ